MNWGFKIGLVYSAFVVMMLFFVFQATRQRNDLVTKDYYAHEGDYLDNQVFAANNQQLTIPVSAAYVGPERAVVIQFPAEMAISSGDAYLYRPSDERLDRHVTLQTDPTGKMSIPSVDLPTGRWILKLSWKSDGKDFYYETPLLIP